MKPKISLAMIVYNEEELLPTTLGNIRPWVDEIVITDTGSTDATVAIAKSFGARVVKHTWKKDFSLARNTCLSYVTGDWVLVLDADEFLIGGEELKALVEGAKAAYQLPIYSPLESQEVLLDYSVRLFPFEHRLKFQGRIHEQILPSLGKCFPTIQLVTIQNSPHIWHRGYEKEVMLKKRKISRNIEIIQEGLELDRDRGFLHYALGCEYLLAGKGFDSWRAFSKALDLVSSKEVYYEDLNAKLSMARRLQFRSLEEGYKMLDLVDKALKIDYWKREIEETRNILKCINLKEGR